MRIARLTPLALFPITMVLGYVAGQFAYSTGLASLVWIIIFSMVCPAALCLLSRSWHVGFGLLVNLFMVVTVTIKSYQFAHRTGGLNDWWRSMPLMVAFLSVIVSLSLIVTIPWSLTKYGSGIAGQGRPPS